MKSVVLQYSMVHRSSKFKEQTEDEEQSNFNISLFRYDPERSYFTSFCIQSNFPTLLDQIADQICFSPVIL